MNQLTQACNDILDQLNDTLEQLSDREFIHPSENLSGSTIGQHLRHTLEFFICLEQGFGRGVINYDKRAHDKAIENNRATAIRAIQQIKKFINTTKPDKPLTLEVGYNLNSDENVNVHTNYGRELTYNIEHAVHHMAIIKIGLREIAPRITVPTNFGVAASTLRHRGEVMIEAS